MTNSSRKVALIVGITGQDGSYLAEFLLSKGYQVNGIMRRASTFNTERIDHIYQDPHAKEYSFRLHYGDLSDASGLIKLLSEIRPDEVYNLGAQSHVKVSFEIPEYTADVDALGTLRLLEAIRFLKLPCKFYQASTSEMFGNSPPPQNEKTVFHPRSPYAAAKVFSHHMAVNYREAYGLFAVGGILFNHESPRRGETFVTRKITRGVAAIVAGRQQKIFLGNLEAKRDWGYAPEYCIDLETQILTEAGFKNYDQIKKGDCVINFNPAQNKIEKDTILKIHLLNFKGSMFIFKGRGLKIQCTPEHRIIFQHKSKSSKGGWSRWKICTAAEFTQKIGNKALRTKYDYRLPPLIGYDSEDIDIEDEWLTFIGYLVAEGCIKFHPGIGRGIAISLSQSKSINPKYYDDIKNVCRALKLTYKERKLQDGCAEFIFNASSTRKILDMSDGFNVHRIPAWILKGSRRQLILVLNAMMNGDGCWSTMTYVSINLSLISDFQTIATKIGYRTTVHKRRSGIFECTLLAQRKAYAYVTEVETAPYHGKVWCVTTKNGSMVIRKDNAVSVIGNCESMWKMLQQDKPEDFVIATGEMHTVREFAQEAFRLVGLDYTKFVATDERYLRPSEVEELQGDASKAAAKLGWKPNVRFKDLVALMLIEDLKKDGLDPKKFALPERHPLTAAYLSKIT